MGQYASTGLGAGVGLVAQEVFLLRSRVRRGGLCYLVGFTSGIFSVVLGKAFAHIFQVVGYDEVCLRAMIVIYGANFQLSRTVTDGNQRTG